MACLNARRFPIQRARKGQSFEAAGAWRQSLPGSDASVKAPRGSPGQPITRTHAGFRRSASTGGDAIRAFASVMSRSQQPVMEIAMSPSDAPAKRRRGGWPCRGQRSPRSLCRVNCLKRSTARRSGSSITANILSSMCFSTPPNLDSRAPGPHPERFAPDGKCRKTALQRGPFRGLTTRSARLEW